MNSCPITDQLIHDVEAGARRVGVRGLRRRCRRELELEDYAELERLPERPRSGRAVGGPRMRTQQPEREARRCVGVRTDLVANFGVEPQRPKRSSALTPARRCLSKARA